MEAIWRERRNPLTKYFGHGKVKKVNEMQK
jgi:hypothetical protein